jgi:hypothetical protein
VSLGVMLAVLNALLPELPETVMCGLVADPDTFTDRFDVPFHLAALFVIRLRYRAFGKE